VYKSVPLQCGHALDNDGPPVSYHSFFTVLRTRTSVPSPTNGQFSRRSRLQGADPGKPSWRPRSACMLISFGRLLRPCWSPTAVLLIPLGDTSNVTANATGGSSSNSHEQCVGQHCGQECHSSVLPTEDASKVPQHRSTGAHKQFKNEGRQDEADQRPAKWPSQTAGDGPYEQSDTGRRKGDDAGLRTEPEDDHESPAESPDQRSNTSSCS